RARSTIKFLGKIEGLPILAVLIILYIAFILTAPDVFTKPRIYMSFLQTVAPPLILGLGLTFVITAGEMDLSFPATVAFAGFVFSWAYAKFSLSVDPTWAAWGGFALALLAGAVVGWVNGILVAKIGVPSIMATLAAQFFWYGVTVLLAGGLQATLKGIEETAAHSIFVGRIYGVIPSEGRGQIGIPQQSLWALGLTILSWFILNRHKFGESVMFLGDNENVARVMGVNVEATRIKLCILMGVFAEIGS